MFEPTSLLVVRAHILAHPEQLCAEVMKASEAAPGLFLSMEPRVKVYQAEGGGFAYHHPEARCFAGWQEELTPVPQEDAPHLSKNPLFCSADYNGEFGTELYAPDGWPPPLTKRYMEAETHEQAAQVGADVIDSFIAWMTAGAPETWGDFYEREA